jgi:hypothetical protein
MVVDFTVASSGCGGGGVGPEGFDGWEGEAAPEPVECFGGEVLVGVVETVAGPGEAVAAGR